MNLTNEIKQRFSFTNPSKNTQFKKKLKKKEIQIHHKYIKRFTLRFISKYFQGYRKKQRGF